MKTIILVRHSKAVSRELDIPDFERSLIKKGKKDAKKVAGILKGDSIQPDLLISSPANRALETAHIFAKELSYPVQKIVIKDTLYNDNSPQKILEMVREIDDKYSSIMIFGHNPSFDEFAQLLDSKFKESISTSGVVSFQFKNKLWKTISKGKGQLQFYEYPLRKLEKGEIYKNVREQIEVKMISEVKQILAEIDPDITKKINKEIDQYCKKLINKFLNSTKTYKVKRISKNLPPKRLVKKNNGKSKTTLKKGKDISPPKKETTRSKSKKTKTVKNTSTQSGNK